MARANTEVQRVAIKALIIKAGKVLILREASTYDEGTNEGRYHLPGGRIEPGEKIEDALQREVQEETGLSIAIKYPVYMGEWRPVIKGVPHQIVGMFVVCEPKTTGHVVLSEEHDKYEWVDPKKRHEYDVMTPDDLAIDTYSDSRDYH